ncbi:hypothetical protein Tco_1191805 [Tanacetum coccineum]
MAALPRCDELRRAVNSSEWEDMFILYYRRAVSEDVRLAREINALCVGLTAVIEEKENFVDELDVLVDRFVPEKMDVFMKESPEEKISQSCMKFAGFWVWEFDLRALEKNLSLRSLEEKLGMECVEVFSIYCRDKIAEFIRETIGKFMSSAVWLGGGVPVFKEEDDTVCSAVGSGVPMPRLLAASSLDRHACNFSASSFHGCPVILSAAGVKKVRGAVAEGGGRRYPPREIRLVCRVSTEVEGSVAYNVRDSSASVGVSKMADTAD